MDFISESEVRPSAAEAFCFYRLERSGVPDYEKNETKCLEIKLYLQNRSIGNPENDRKSEILALCDRMKMVTRAAVWKKGSLALFLINFWLSTSLWRESPVAGR